MKNYLLIFMVFIFCGGCSTTRKINKSSSEVKIEKDIEAKQSLKVVDSSTKSGKSTIIESSTIEEISVKKTPAIELTANFKIDSNATLKGDTALKLIDVSDKNVSVTIYQNGKNGVLTAKIKSKSGVADVPFSEINIKKSSTSKITDIDTSKAEKHEVIVENSLIDKSKTSMKTSEVEKDISKINYSFLIIFGLALAFILFFVWNKNW
ncbi:hypothetical protein [Pedobacter aquatilis]|uniref:hypothetical protein n=1 Tax=Pedobacter aquatilis TaxID=351343 RepID=UPI00292D4B03|nr:hypothetical protein [Pedobacter aquatilis]